MYYYLILENGFTRKEKDFIQHVNQKSFERCQDIIGEIMQSVFFKGIDRFNRWIYTGINKQGYSATIAILESEKPYNEI